MSSRTSPPFRADHVGSLLRPPRLHQARADLAAGRITAAGLRAVEDEEIVKAIRMQEEVGLQSATDGEFRRATWHMDFIYQLGGVSQAAGHLAVKFISPSGTIEWTPAALHVGSTVRLDHTIFGEDFTFVRDHVTTAVPKLTIPSPNMVHYRGGPASIDSAVYPDMGAFWACCVPQEPPASPVALRTFRFRVDVTLYQQEQARCAIDQETSGRPSGRHCSSQGAAPVP